MTLLYLESLWQAQVLASGSIGGTSHVNYDLLQYNFSNLVKTLYNDQLSSSSRLLVQQKFPKGNAEPDAVIQIRGSRLETSLNLSRYVAALLLDRCLAEN